MRVIALIENDPAIQKILKHMGSWKSRSHSPPPSPIYEEIVYADESANSSMFKDSLLALGITREVCPRKDKILTKYLNNLKVEPHNIVRQRGFSHLCFLSQYIAYPPSHINKRNFY